MNTTMIVLVDWQYQNITSLTIFFEFLLKVCTIVKLIFIWTGTFPIPSEKNSHIFMLTGRITVLINENYNLLAVFSHQFFNDHWKPPYW